MPRIAVDISSLRVSRDLRLLVLVLGNVVSGQTPTRDRAVLLTPTDAARPAKVSRDTIYLARERAA